MLNKIRITESEKNNILSLHGKKNILFEQNSFKPNPDALKGKDFQIDTIGGKKTYRILTVNSSRTNENVFIISANQLRTNERQGQKWFGGHKQFYFDCGLDAIYGYDGKINDSEKYTSSDNPTVDDLLTLLKSNLCGS